MGANTTLVRFEIRIVRPDGTIRDIGFTNDYATAVQFVQGGYDVTGFTNYYRTTNEVK